MIHPDIIELMNEVQEDLEDLLYGSVELHVQDGKVTQVTVRRIKKTSDFAQSSATSLGVSHQNIQTKQKQNKRKNRYLTT